MNSLDKRADCTTTLGLDVDAAPHDRMTASCGVSDVLATLATSALAGLSHAFTPGDVVLNSHPHSHAPMHQYPLSCLALGIQ
jgi:hypothetical protein